MADVLLAHCNHLYYDRKQVRKMQPYPPLQVLLAAALLEREGFEVALFDAAFFPPEVGFRQALAHHRPAVVALCEDNFNFLTKMCLTHNRELAFEMCRIAGADNIPVLVNSSDATERPELYLDHGADYVLSGEVEITLLETLQSLLGKSNNSLEQIRGLSFRSAGRIRHTGPRAPLTDLDLLPAPAWHLAEVDSYRAAWMKAHGFFSLNLVSSRGCPFRCNWCAKPIHGQTYHSHSPERVAGEMLFLKSSFHPDEIWFADDIFALSTSWTLRFAEEVERLNAGIPFKIQSRSDLMTPEMTAALRRAGCAEVWMGAESGSQRILDAMDKGLKVREIYEARANLRRQGIRACYFLQFGYPGEEWEDIRRTIQMVRETEPDDVGISVAYPLPGTVFYDRVVSELGSKQNWADSEDLSLLFRGAYSTEFYRALHDAIHLDLETRKNPDAIPFGVREREALWARVEDLSRTPVRSSSPALWTSS